jgi:ADP-ribose pyrophosphatase
MDFNEKTISTQPIFTGKIVKLRVDTVALPDGRESTREIVEHRGAVAIVAINQNNEIFMVRQYRKPVEKTLLEIPAGTMEDNEDPLDCARRELSEETGLTAAHWEHILSYYSAPGFSDELLHLYLATDLQPGDTHPDQDEFLELVKMPLKEACTLIYNGTIVDGKSIIGIQYAIKNLPCDVK